MVETSDEWITTRTGIKERRIATDMVTSDMAVEAVKNALESAGRSHEEIDLLVVGTVTPDYLLPSTACIVQEKIGLPKAACFDVVAACTGFINGLGIAASYVETGRAKCAAVVGVEKLSSITNYEDRNTCVLFGDAAGAAILEKSDSGSGVLSTVLESNGKYREMLWIEVGGTVEPYSKEFDFSGRNKIYMNGSEVFKVAVREMCKASLKAIERAGLQPEDISLIVPHQANIRIIEAIAKRLRRSMDHVFVNIEKYGNTSAASIPLALDEAAREGRIKEGDNVLMVAFGGGLIWGASVVKW